MLGTTNLNYIGIKPLRDSYGDVVGTYVQQVFSMNLGGSIPDRFKARKVKNMTLGLVKMIDYLQYNKICSDEEDFEADQLAFDTAHP